MRQLLTNGSLEFTALNGLGVDHHVRPVIGPDREQAPWQDLRYLIDTQHRSVGVFAHKDRPPCPIGRVDVMVQEVDQQYPLPRHGILQGNPARVTGSGIGRHPSCVDALQLLLVHRHEACKQTLL
ncbi:hypothetical protein D3C87_1247260 [compost metagenome]